MTNNLLPFETPTPPTPLELGGLSVPRYGSLTVWESMVLERFIATDYQAAIALATGELSTAIAASYLQTVLAAVLLISRHSPTWTLERVGAELSPEQISMAAEFLLNERRRWQDPKPEQSPKEGQPSEEPAELDWARLFRRLQLGYPGDRWFSSENFGNCPLILIEQALEQLQERELQAASTAATPIALLGVYLLSAQGVKRPKPEWINPFQRLLDKRQAKQVIPPEAAQTFLALTAENKVPGWVLSFVDIDAIRLTAED